MKQPNVSHKRCSHQGRKWTSVSPWLGVGSNLGPAACECIGKALAVNQSLIRLSFADSNMARPCRFKSVLKHLLKPPGLSALN